MKKYIILSILSLFLIGNVNAQTDSTKVELTKEQVYNDVKGALQQLGDALKVGAEHVYGVLVKQQLVNSITYTITFIITLFGMYSAYKLIIKNTDKLSYSESENYMVCGIVLAVVFGISFIVHLICMGDIVGGFVNPEYGAIKEILNTIK